MTNYVRVQTSDVPVGKGKDWPYRRQHEVSSDQWSIGLDKRVKGLVGAAASGSGLYKEYRCASESQVMEVYFFAFEWLFP